MASVAPTYFVWITPELFNFSLVLLGYFCWLYKEVAAPESLPAARAGCFRPGSDLAAAALLGVATFSKPSNLLLVLPLLGMAALASAVAQAHRSPACCSGPSGPCSSPAIVAITGDWNFQGGDRRTFYGTYPFQERGAAVGRRGPGPRHQPGAAGRPSSTGASSGRSSRTTWPTSSSAVTRACCRTSSRASSRSCAFLLARGKRAPWQWLVLAAAAAEMLLLLLWVPYTFNGGGGSIGNRYFMSTYGVLLFLLPPICRRWRGPLVPWVVGALFSAQTHLQPVLLLLQPVRAGQAGAAALAPRRTDAGQRPAHQHAAEPRAGLVRRGAAVPDLLPGRQRVRPRGPDLLGEGPSRRPSSS